jgi:hypothetical protein
LTYTIAATSPFTMVTTNLFVNAPFVLTGSQIVVTCNGIRNPRSLAPSSGFSVYSMNSVGDVVEEELSS